MLGTAHRPRYARWRRGLSKPATTTNAGPSRSECDLDCREVPGQLRRYSAGNRRRGLRFRSDHAVGDFLIAGAVRSELQQMASNEAGERLLGGRVEVHSALAQPLFSSGVSIGRGRAHERCQWAPNARCRTTLFRALMRAASGDGPLGEAELDRPHGGLCAITRLELRQQSGYVILYGSGTEVQVLTDLLIGQPLCEELRNVALARGEVLRHRHIGRALQVLFMPEHDSTDQLLEPSFACNQFPVQHGSLRLSVRPVGDIPTDRQYRLDTSVFGTLGHDAGKEMTLARGCRQGELQVLLAPAPEDSLNGQVPDRHRGRKHAHLAARLASQFLRSAARRPLGSRVRVHIPQAGIESRNQVRVVFDQRAELLGARA